MLVDWLWFAGSSMLVGWLVDAGWLDDAGRMMLVGWLYLVRWLIDQSVGWSMLVD
jgi:hypothetical protein